MKPKIEKGIQYDPNFVFNDRKKEILPDAGIHEGIEREIDIPWHGGYNFWDRKT